MVAEVSLFKLPLAECLSNDKSTLVHQAVRQQAITWANVYLDLCRHMTSLGNIELIYHGLVMEIYVSVNWISFAPDLGQTATQINADLLSIGTLEQTSVKFEKSRKFNVKCCQQTVDNTVQASIC